MRLGTAVLGMAALATAEPWLASFDAAVEQARASARPILVVIVDESPYSARLERLLSQPAAEAWTRDRVVCVREKTSHGASTPLLRRFGGRGLPVLSVVDVDGNVTGYRAGAPEETPESWIATVAPWAEAAAVGTGIRAYHAKRYDEARRWLAASADRGDPAALTFLGKMLAEGWGGGADAARAEACYRRAVDKDHDDAFFNLGLLLLPSKGEEAMRLIEEAERRGHPKAALFLAERCWATGEGAKGDAYALRAMHAGHYSPAARRLAERALAAGREAEAVTWWGEAAPGDPVARQALDTRAVAGDPHARVECALANLLGRELTGLTWEWSQSRERLQAWLDALGEEGGTRAAVAAALLRNDANALAALAGGGDELARAWAAYRKDGDDAIAALGEVARGGGRTAVLLLEQRARRGDTAAVRELALLYEQGPPSWRVPKRAQALRASAPKTD